MVPRGDDGGIHEISRLIGSLESQVKTTGKKVDDLITWWSQRDERAHDEREKLHDKFDEVKGEVQGLKGTVENVQQTVAEMQNDQEAAKRTLEDYQRDKVVFVATVDNVKKLQGIVQSFQNTEQRAIGAWAVISRIGKVGWVIIAAGITGGFAIFYQYVLPHWL